MNYPVNEMFETVQGEATWTGTPSVFIRLQGCPVGCPWCDTKHTWETKPEAQVTIPLMLAKTADTQGHAVMSVEQIVETVGSYRAKHVVITGGEPCLYDLTPLTRRLFDLDYTVQIETSGTHEIKVDGNTWITVSPKLDMPGGFKVMEDAIHRADEIKFPIGKASDYDKLRDFVLPYVFSDATVWLQPLSQNRSATALCVALATQHGHRVSIQTHKFIGIR